MLRSRGLTECVRVSCVVYHVSCLMCPCVMTLCHAGLDEAHFIVPGLGDFGDRYYGTDGYIEGYWGRDGK